MGTFANINDLRPLRVWDSAVARTVQGDRITLAVVELEPDVSVPEHRHGNEQLGIVLKGSITMTVDGCLAKKDSIPFRPSRLRSTTCSEASTPCS